MKLISVISRSTIVAALALAGLAAHADTLDNIRAAKKIRISIDVANPPSGMTDSAMRPTGSDVDVATLLAKDLGVALEIVPTTGATRIPNLQTNKADLVISTLAFTPERAKVIDYSIPYAGQVSLVGGIKGVNVKSMADLAGKSVAVNRSTTQDADLTANAKGATIVRYDDDAAVITAAVTGQADLVATSGALFQTMVNKAPARQLEPKFVLRTFDLGVGMRKEEPKLMAWVNDWVRTNMKNGKLNEIFKKYHGADIPESVVSQAK
ncbi:transporter substrate-binding domain-containing protein [Polaromonas sp. P1(28)-13]|nr:transporter substrate-binding domain-containing protein [Polaromonas sp. P1(28)-13]